MKNLKDNNQSVELAVENAKLIAKKYSDVFFSFSEEQMQIYFNFNERICDEWGEEITNKTAIQIENEMLELGFEGALLQSEIEEIDYQTLCFNIN